MNPRQTPNSIAFAVQLLILFGICTCVRGAAPSPAAKFPCPVDADLWVLAGQSNMAGFGYIKEPEQADPRILAFDMSNRWMPALDPLHRTFEAVAPVHKTLILGEFGPDPKKAEELYRANRELLRHNKDRGAGPGRFFAQRLVQATGRPVGLIPCAHGGTSMAQWDPALKAKGGNSLYGAMLERIRLTGGNPKGILWYQGESEAGAGSDPKAYHQKLLDFVDCVRRDTGKPDLPFIYVQISRVIGLNNVFDVKAWEQVREAQRLAAHERKNLYFVSAIDLTLDDPIHLSWEGQRQLGQRLAEVALTYAYQRPAHGRMIDLKSIEVRDRLGGFPVLHLRFSGVSGRLKSAGRPTGFELREASAAYKQAPGVYRIDLDPQDPSALNLYVSGPLVGPVKLVCGGGLDPYVNIVDDKGMALPAFGPVDVPLGK